MIGLFNFKALQAEYCDLSVQDQQKLKDKIALLETQLTDIAKQYYPAVLANSLGYEDMILTDVIARLQLPINIFTLQTGLLHAETMAMLTVIKSHYQLDIIEYKPLADQVTAYLAQHGKNAMYESIALRRSCCDIRKLEPLQRALANKKAWITGQRVEQSMTRHDLKQHEFDAVHQLDKFNPLWDWELSDIYYYIHHFNVPYNALHDQGYPSIGCEPCTRAISVGEDIRAGRWWWEENQFKECGLHLHVNVDKPSI